MGEMNCVLLPFVFQSLVYTMKYSKNEAQVAENTFKRLDDTYDGTKMEQLAKNLTAAKIKGLQSGKFAESKLFDLTAAITEDNLPEQISQVYDEFINVIEYMNFLSDELKVCFEGNENDENSQKIQAYSSMCGNLFKETIQNYYIVCTLYELDTNQEDKKREEYIRYLVSALKNLSKINRENTRLPAYCTLPDQIDLNSPKMFCLKVFRDLLESGKLAEVNSVDSGVNILTHIPTELSYLMDGKLVVDAQATYSQTKTKLNWCEAKYPANKTIQFTSDQKAVKALSCLLRITPDDMKNENSKNTLIKGIHLLAQHLADNTALEFTNKKSFDTNILKLFKITELELSDENNFEKTPKKDTQETKKTVKDGEKTTTEDGEKENQAKSADKKKNDEDDKGAFYTQTWFIISCAAVVLLVIAVGVYLYMK